MKLICILICFGENRKLKSIILLISILEQEAKNASLCWVQCEGPHPPLRSWLLSGCQYSTSTEVEAEGQGRQDLPALVELTLQRRRDTRKHMNKYGLGIYTNIMWGRVRQRAVSATTFEQWVSCCTQSWQKSIAGRGNSRFQGGWLFTWKKLWLGPSQWIGRRMMTAEVAMKAVDGSCQALWDTIRSLDLPNEKWHLWRDFREEWVVAKIPFVYQDNQPGWREKGGRRMS